MPHYSMEGNVVLPCSSANTPSTILVLSLLFTSSRVAGSLFLFARITGQEVQEASGGLTTVNFILVPGIISLCLKIREQNSPGETCWCPKVGYLSQEPNILWDKCVLLEGSFGINFWTNTWCDPGLFPAVLRSHPGWFLE